MRILALPVVAAGILLATAATKAQTYDPNYPVCLHVFGPVTYFECSYTSLPQCNLSASGRAAQCETNPYFVSERFARPVVRHYHHRRHHRAY